MYAAQNGYTEIVKILLEHGADISTKDVYGKSHRITSLINIFTLFIHFLYLFNFISINRILFFIYIFIICCNNYQSIYTLLSVYL